MNKMVVVPRAPYTSASFSISEINYSCVRERSILSPRIIRDILLSVTGITYYYINTYILRIIYIYTGTYDNMRARYTYTYYNIYLILIV